MTGDGVNHAPALKVSHVGISVQGATDAARAAADIVLTSPDLNAAIEAITIARRIFARMNSFLIYRVAATIQVRPDNPCSFSDGAFANRLTAARVLFHCHFRESSESL